MTFATDHRALLAPATPVPAPAPRWSVPALWRVACAYIASMLDVSGGAQALVRRGRISGTERNAILAWLIPAERMVRQLLLTKAITFLLMTPAGLRLRRNAKPLTPPKPPAPPPPPFGTTRMITIPLGATIARHYKYRPKAPPRPAVDLDDPETWRVQFRVLRWLEPGSAPKPPQRPLHATAHQGSGAGLARRMEALRRTLSRSQARIHRLARYLARLPRNLLGLPPPHLYRRNKPLSVLRDERFALFDLVSCAVEAFDSS